MTRNINYLGFLSTLGIPLTLIVSMVLLAKSALFVRYPEQLSMGITFDLVITVPLVYFLLIRKREIPKTTVVPFFILGLVVASFILPAGHQFYLTQIKHWVLPVVEISVFLFVGFKVTKTVKEFRKQKNETPDFFTAIRTATLEVLPQALSRPFAIELGVIYYGFISWRKKALKPNEFSYHKKTATMALLGVFILIIFAETIALHLLLQMWSDIAAWVLTILSVYTGLQVFGIARSMSKRPLAIEADSIELRYGLLSETTIKLENIEEVAPFKGPVEKDGDTVQLSPLGELEACNVVIHLKEENTLYGLYGIKKTATSIALHVDEPQRFEEMIKSRS